jgi:hypothetical protein
MSSSSSSSISKMKQAPEGLPHPVRPGTRVKIITRSSNYYPSTSSPPSIRFRYGTSIWVDDSPQVVRRLQSRGYRSDGILYLDLMSWAYPHGWWIIQISILITRFCGLHVHAPEWFSFPIHACLLIIIVIILSRKDPVSPCFSSPEA